MSGGCHSSSQSEKRVAAGQYGQAEWGADEM